MCDVEVNINNNIVFAIDLYAVKTEPKQEIATVIHELTPPTLGIFL